MWIRIRWGRLAGIVMLTTEVLAVRFRDMTRISDKACFASGMLGVVAVQTVAAGHGRAAWTVSPGIGYGTGPMGQSLQSIQIFHVKPILKNAY